MFLPDSYPVALGMMILGMIFWGSWANTFKLTRNWRMELYYWDYAIGIFLTSIIVGMTLGTMHGGPTFASNLASADGSAWAFAFCAGALWNCGNILMMFGVALVGLAVAFPIAIGLALVVGVIGSYLVQPRGDVTLLLGGVALVFIAVIFNSLAYKAAHASGRSERGVSKSGLVACLAAGALFSGFGPLVGKALSTPNPLAPYGVVFFFTLGALVSTIPLLTYFMHRPLEGSPLTSGDYRRGRPRDHFAGLAGGFLWSLGTTFTFVAASMVGIALAYAIGQANPLIAALWGVFVWHEFRGAPRRAQALLTCMFALYVAGLLMLASSFNAK